MRAPRVQSSGPYLHPGARRVALPSRASGMRRYAPRALPTSANQSPIGRPPFTTVVLALSDRPRASQSCAGDYTDEEQKSRSPTDRSLCDA